MKALRQLDHPRIRRRNAACRHSTFEMLSTITRANMNKVNLQSELISFSTEEYMLQFADEACVLVNDIALNGQGLDARGLTMAELTDLMGSLNA